MLSKANRITQGSEYKRAVRGGRRYVSANLVTYIRVNPESEAARFGFIVGKGVGLAHRRNRVRRQLKAVCHELLPTVDQKAEIVIRALPASANAPWVTLHEELSQAINKGAIRL